MMPTAVHTVTVASIVWTIYILRPDHASLPRLFQARMHSELSLGKHQTAVHAKLHEASDQQT